MTGDDGALALEILRKAAADMGGGWVTQAYNDSDTGMACLDTGWLDLTADEFRLLHRLTAEADAAYEERRRSR